ncbi:MAG: aminotransferase class V-fold PLP-dependent enzyme [Clostridia bacterium]|nr:aminotransferase class V-fold PLP-dependent enzyme [Clostridia bacterium]
MKTPIFDFVKSYADKNPSRLHMPGHKGAELLGCEKYDITEISGADSLFEASGIIKESEENAAELFGALRTLYSTEGSTQSIKAMVYLALKNRKVTDTKPVIAATRNAHKSFVYACALLDIDIFWIYGRSDKFSLCECGVTAEDIDNAIKESDAFAVFVTSPDYLGNMLDIKAFSDTAHKHNIPLLVDNAHGAYLAFLEQNRHPIALGADMCCDSAHKTLPVLTGGAYLHINNKDFANDGKAALSLFCSTSPSYLTLASLDLANKYLIEDYGKRLCELIKKLNKLKEALRGRGFTVLDTDPLKLTVKNGGIALSRRLKEYNCEAEYESPDFTVLMFTPENEDKDFIAIENALTAPPSLKDNGLLAVRPKAVCSPRAALFSKSEEVNTEDACGRVLADVSVSCPPAVPILVSGEEISEDSINIFRYYGIKKIKVIK